MVDASTDFQRGRFLVLSKYIEQIIREESQSYTIQLTKELDDFAQYESDFFFPALGGAVTVNTVTPAPAQIIAALTRKPMVLIQGQGEARLTLQELTKVFQTPRLSK